MIGPLSRIVARWIAGGLVFSGLLLPEEATILSTDPEVLALVGGVIGIVTEYLYLQAKKRGWAT